jgi:hypothetical protein
MMIAWACLVVPTVVWWKDSILWVAFMSLYANFVGHFSAWGAVRAEDKADNGRQPRAAEQASRTAAPS